MKSPVHLSEEVRDALANGQAVVALESTIVTHGMPWPTNLETARGVAAVVRAAGAVPATVALWRGEVWVGLPDERLAALAQDEAVLKVSRRDLAVAVAQRRSGGTTVAATMWAAAQAGVAVFATGGIGGVHRGATETFDVSADLIELGRTPVVVVCAGAKSILDLPLTLEYLETQGVPVVGYGTDRFPAFYARDSGLPLVARADTPAELAAIWRAHRVLGLGGGLVVANPVPTADALPQATVRRAVDEALATAYRAEVRGKALTPYLLDYLARATDGATLRTNVALVLHNARVAAQMAVALANSA